MLIHRLKVARLLSFGPDGVDLPMEPLNVLIGPNGSGKSNFLEALALLQAAPGDISEPIANMGGVREWLWKGPEAPDSFTLEAYVGYPPGGSVYHALTLADRNGRPEVTHEQVKPVGMYTDERLARSFNRPPEKEWAEPYRLETSPNVKNENVAGRMLGEMYSNRLEFESDCLPTVSLVSLANASDHPALWHLNRAYRDIRLYRDWTFGPLASLRLPADTHEHSDYLNEQGTNLAAVLSNFAGDNKRRLIVALRKLYDGIVDVTCPVTGGTVALCLDEGGNSTIPATRLSDGTLRYLCLLSVLLNPQPPPLVVIDEPELGLHPDLLPTLSDLLRLASKRTQLVVTTHSDVLVDALTDDPESVVVCEKHAGQTEMRRLDRNQLAKWLDSYRLGELWTSGELGGNRW